MSRLLIFYSWYVKDSFIYRCLEDSYKAIWIIKILTTFSTMLFKHKIPFAGFLYKFFFAAANLSIYHMCLLAIFLNRDCIKFLRDALHLHKTSHYSKK